MVAKYISVVVHHETKDYEFGTNNFIISNQELPLSDSEIRDDFNKNAHLINNILNNLVQAKLYSNMANAVLALKLNNLSAEISITYVGDLEKCKRVSNVLALKNLDQYNDKVSAVRCYYTYGEDRIHTYLAYGNPSSMDEFIASDSIDFEVPKIYL